MTRGVNETNLTLRDSDVVGTNVLRYSAGLTRGNARLADVIQKRRLTVINMTHYGDYRWARLFFAFNLKLLLKRLLDRIIRYDLHFMTHFFYNQSCSVLIENLIDRRHDTKTHQDLDNFASFNTHTLGKFAHGNHVP